MSWDDTSRLIGYAFLTIIVGIVGYAVVWVWKGIVK